jgi:catechol 2,3-dioxygenase-like lactoylglutathione lyase family enzyme
MIKKGKQFLETTVILPVKDVKQTAEFYKQKLGFNIDLLCENPNYGSVSRENVIIEFGAGRKKFAGSGVCFIHVKDVDEVHKELKTSGVEFVGDLSDRDYGSRDFRIKDNNENLLIFESPLSNKKELLRRLNKV